MPVNQSREAVDLCRPEEIGRTAPEMKLHRLALPRNQGFVQGQFFLQQIQVIIGAALIQTRDHVATTEPAEGLAKRQMKIKRERSLFLAKRFQKRAGILKLTKMVRGRIAGITRAGPVILLNQFKVLGGKMHSKSNA